MEKTQFFSYPFGEYSTDLKKIVIDLGFKYTFGQHSGVVDETKNYFEMPDFQLMNNMERQKDLRRYSKLYLFPLNLFNQREDTLMTRIIHLK